MHVNRLDFRACIWKIFNAHSKTIRICNGNGKQKSIYNHESANRVNSIFIPSHRSTYRPILMTNIIFNAPICSKSLHRICCCFLFAILWRKNNSFSIAKDEDFLVPREVRSAQKHSKLKEKLFHFNYKFAIYGSNGANESTTNECRKTITGYKINRLMKWYYKPKRSMFFPSDFGCNWTWHRCRKTDRSTCVRIILPFLLILLLFFVLPNLHFHFVFFVTSPSLSHIQARDCVDWLIFPLIVLFM